MRSRDDGTAQLSNRTRHAFGGGVGGRESAARDALTKSLPPSGTRRPLAPPFGGIWLPRCVGVAGTRWPCWDGARRAPRPGMWFCWRSPPRDSSRGWRSGWIGQPPGPGFRRNGGDPIGAGETVWMFTQRVAPKSPSARWGADSAAERMASSPFSPSALRCPTGGTRALASLAFFSHPSDATQVLHPSLCRVASHICITSL